MKKDEAQIKVQETQAIAQNDEEYGGSICQVGSEDKVESVDMSFSYGKFGDPCTSIRHRTTNKCRI